MITAENLERIYVQVALGVPKSRSPFPLTKEMSETWDQLAIEVQAIFERGGTLEPPSMEVPKIEVPKPREVP